MSVMTDKPAVSYGAQLLGLYGLAHFLVDFVCAVTVVAMYDTHIPAGHYFALVIAYNLLAFGAQPFWGWLSDRWQHYPRAAAIGLAAVGAGAVVSALQPVAGVVLLGCGNALFHVSGGAVVYNAAPGRASGPGIFVAPGGVGLFAGIMLGLQGGLASGWLLPPLVLVAFLIWQFKPASAPITISQTEELHWKKLFCLALLLLLLVVAIRSMNGFVLTSPWSKTLYGPYLLAFAAFAGKALGGVCADRFGWKAFGCSMLLLTAIAGYWYRDFLLCAGIALFAVQATTGITLAGVQSLFTGRPAFAFGLPCVAIVLVALPFLAVPTISAMNAVFVSLGCISAFFAAIRVFTLDREVKEARA